MDKLKTNISMEKMHFMDPWNSMPMINQREKEWQLPSRQQIILVASMTQQLWSVFKGKEIGRG